MTQEGSDYLDSLGIKEHVIAWKNLYDQLKLDLKNEDESKKSISNFKLILDAVSNLTKDEYISLVHVLYRERYRNPLFF